MSIQQNIIFSLIRFTEPDRKETSPDLNNPIIRALVIMRLVDGMNEQLVIDLKEQTEIDFPQEVNFEDLQSYFEYDKRDGFYKWFSPYKKFFKLNELSAENDLTSRQFFFKFFETMLKNLPPTKPDAVEPSHLFAYEQAAKQLYNFHPQKYVRWTLEWYSSFEFSKLKIKAVEVLLEGLKLQPAYAISKLLVASIHVKAAMVIRSFSYEDALSHYYKALELVNEASTPQTPSEDDPLATDKFLVLFGLSLLFEEAGPNSKALQYINECVQDYKRKNYSTEFPQLYALFFQGKYALNEYVCMQSLKKSEISKNRKEEVTDQVLAKNHELSVLSKIYYLQNRYEAAEVMEKILLTADIATLGSTHEIVISDVVRLSNFLLCQNKFEEALKYINQIGHTIQARKFERYEAARVLSLEAYLSFMVGSISEEKAIEIIEISIRNLLVKSNKLTRIAVDCYIILARMLMRSESTLPAAKQILTECIHFYEFKVARPYHPAQKMILELLLSLEDNPDWKTKLDSIQNIQRITIRFRYNHAPLEMVRDEMAKQFAEAIQATCFWLLPSEEEIYELTSCKLDFFPGYSLTILHIPEAYGDKYFLHKKDTSEIPVLNALLDGSNQLIYEVAKEIIHKWDDFSPDEQLRMAKAYTFFFFDIVQGSSGRFHLVEALEDIPWLEDLRRENNEEQKEKILPHLTPLTLIENASARFTFRACMIFQDSLFKATISITTDGSVFLSDEELVVEDLPVRVDKTD